MATLRLALVALLLLLGVAQAAQPPIGYSVGPPPENGGTPVGGSGPPVTWYSGTGWNASVNADLPRQHCTSMGCVCTYYDSRFPDLTGWTLNGSICTFYYTANGAPYFNSVTVSVWGSICSDGSTPVGGQCPSPAACPSGFTAVGGTCYRCGAGLKPWAPQGSNVASCITDYEKDCPYGTHTGEMSWTFSPGQTLDAPACVEIDGWEAVNPSRLRKCEAIATGQITVCASSGCNSDQGRLTGRTCTVQNGAVPPAQAATNCAGRDWCKNTGTCPQGYVAGDISGESVCVVAGKVVAWSEQSGQPGKTILPPYEREPRGQDTNPIENGGIGGLDAEGEEGGSPAGRLVVSIGGATATGAPGGGGSGSGSGGMGEITTCGLPGTPPCKIDETGTPTQGDFSGPNAEMDAAKGDWEELIGDAAGTDGKSTAWDFTFSLPTSCSAMVVAFPEVTFTLDPCEWRVWSDPLISIIWLGTTIWSIIGMVGRAIGTG